MTAIVMTSNDCAGWLTNFLNKFTSFLQDLDSVLFKYKQQVHGTYLSQKKTYYWGLQDGVPQQSWVGLTTVSTILHHSTYNVNTTWSSGQR